MKYLSTLFIALTFSMSAMALPPQIEFDRLLLQAKTALDAKDYTLAAQSLAKAETLGVKLPDNFYYHYGRAYAGTDKPEKGREMLEKYLTMSGAKGKYYQEALIELNNVEATITKRDAAIKAENAKKVEDLDRYTESLAKYKNNVANCPNEYKRVILQPLEDILEHKEKANKDCRWESATKGYDPDFSACYRQKDQEWDADEALRKARNEEDTWCKNRYSEPTKPQSLR